MTQIVCKIHKDVGKLLFNFILNNLSFVCSSEMTLIAQYVHKRKGKANIHDSFIFLNNFFLFSSDLSLENSDEPDIPYLPGIKWQINLSLC